MKPQKLPEVLFTGNFAKTSGIEISYLKDLSKEEMPQSHSPYKPHRLRFNIIIILLETSGGKHSIDLKTYTYKKNTALLIAQEQIHHFIDLPNQNDGIVIRFNNNAFTELEASYPLLTDHFYNHHLYSPKMELPLELVNELQEITKLLREENNKKGSPFRKVLVQSFLKIILIKLVEHRLGVGDRNDSNLIAFIEFQRAVKTHFRQKKKVAEYADLLNTTTQRLNTLSYHVVNTSAKTYIINTILLEAKRYLAGTNLSSKEIAYELGFNEPTNFIKFFKKHSQVLPSVFKASL